MSLIHEALKRVEAQKDPTGPGGGTGGSPLPDAPAHIRLAMRSQTAPDVSESLPPPVSIKSFLFRRSSMAMVVGLVLTVSATLAALYVVRHDMATPPASKAPASNAEASPDKAAKPAAATEVRVSAQAAAPAEAPAPTPTPTAAESPAAPEAAKPAAATPAPAAPPPTPVAKEIAPPPVQQVSTPPAAASKLKVTGIMTGPMGAAALINGRIVYVGQEIEGARLLKTTDNTVEMEMAGVRFTLGIQP